MEDIGIINSNNNTNDNNISNYIEIIVRQTDYTEEIAFNKLKEFNYDYMKVIKDFLGIVTKKQPVIKSVNQEIYKQIRYKLDSSMRDYNIRKEKCEKKNV